MLRKSDKKKLFGKVTIALGEIITELNKDPNDPWLDGEISELTGIHQSRLSEIKNFQKYNKPVNSKILSRLILGGIIVIEDILIRIKCSEEERRYLVEVGFLEDIETIKTIKEAIKAGVNIKTVLRDAIKKKGNKKGNN